MRTSRIAATVGVTALAAGAVGFWGMAPAGRSEPTPTGPAIRVPATIDVGERNLDHVVLTQFRIENVGSETLEAQLMVFVAGEPNHPTRVSVHGRVAAPVEVSPAEVVLPRKSSSGWAYATVCVVRRSDGKPFTLTPLAVPDGLGCEVTGTETHRLVTVSTKHAPGVWTVRLEARAGEQSWPVTIPVRVREVPQ